MTLQKLKEQVLRGSHISKEEAEWTMPGKLQVVCTVVALQNPGRRVRPGGQRRMPAACPA